MFIDITHVPDLNVVSATSSGLTVGAAISLAQLIDLCAQQDPMSPTFTNDASTETVTTATSSFSALARHLLLVATRQVCYRHGPRLLFHRKYVSACIVPPCVDPLRGLLGW